MKRLILLAALLVAGCAQLGLVKPASTDAQILAAYKTTDAVIVSTDLALNTKLITPAQAQSVSTIAHQVVPLLNSAKAASAANDTAGANKVMALINTLLAGLTAYVPPAPTGAK